MQSMAWVYMLTELANNSDEAAIGIDVTSCEEALNLQPSVSTLVAVMINSLIETLRHEIAEYRNKFHQ